LQPHPHFGARVWRRIVRVWRRIVRVWSKSLAFSVLRILGFPLRFSVQRSVLLVGQKSLAPKSFRATMEGAPLPRTHSTPSPRAKTQHNPARTAYADRALPWSLGSSPTSPALGAKVWRKVWGKSPDFESLEQSLSFFYEISRTPLRGGVRPKTLNQRAFHLDSTISRSLVRERAHTEGGSPSVLATRAVSRTIRKVHWSPPRQHARRFRSKLPLAGPYTLHPTP